MNGLNEDISCYCMPLWFQEGEQFSPQILASSTLLVEDGDHYLVTAGHVGKTLIEPLGPPYVATQDWFITRFGYWKGFRTIDEGPHNPDIEYIHLLDEVSHLPDFLKWAAPSADSDGGKFDYYFAVGFAATRNKRPKRVPAGMILKKPSSTLLKCSTHPHADRVLQKLGYDEQNHIVVSYRRRSYSVGGIKITAPYPAGMSGGLLVGVREENGVKVFRSCGIITEYIENSAALVGTKMGMVRHMLTPYRKLLQGNA